MRFPLWFRDISIRRKFIFITFFATVAAMLFAILLITVIQWFMLREELVKSVSAQVSVIASISAAELAANDREAAEKTLGALANIDSIEFAGVLDKRGKELALYLRPGIVMPPHQHQAVDVERHIDTAAYIDVVVPVVLKQKEIAQIHVRSSMAPVYEKLKWNIAVTVAAAAGAFLVAVLLLILLLPAITGPLQNLVALMNSVSRENNFSLRAALHGNDETGMLAKGFNTMLAQIQNRDDELAQQRQFLEEEVAKRTADLLASNEQLSILLNALPVAVYRCKAEGDFEVMYMSQNVLSFTGYTPGDFIEDHDLWFKRIHPDDAPTVSAGIALLFEKGTHACEYRWLSADGSYIWIQDSLKLIRADDGTPMYMAGMWQDITERMLEKNKLSAKTTFFETLVNTSADGIIVVDPEGKKILQNRRAIELWKIPEEIAADPDDSRQVQHVMDTTVDPKQFVDKVLYLYSHPKEISQDEITLKDGTILERYSAPVIDSNGHIYGRIWSFRDITERKEAEEKIRQSEIRYRGIFEYADDIIYLLTPDGTFNSLNPAFERLTGWRTDEWVGEPFAPIIHTDDLPRAVEVFKTALAGHSTPLFELRIAKKSGDYFDSELSIVPVDPGGEIAAIGIARDVTERKHAEEKIRKLNEELEVKVKERTQQLLSVQEELLRKEKLAVLGQVVGSVGHELRNPLGVMSNAVYYLQTVLFDADESVREYLDLIQNEIDDSERIVSDLLDSVRTKTPQPEDVDVARLIEQVLSKLTIPSTVTVKLKIPATLPSLHVDALQIHQVLRNLISNAMEAMPDGGVLEISAAGNREGGTLALSIHDSGTGMTPEQLKNLFQPLFTTKARGIGLGLMVVKNLTQGNGGTVAVESEVGRGTTFTVTLPSDSLSVREI